MLMLKITLYWFVRPFHMNFGEGSLAGKASFGANLSPIVIDPGLVAKFIFLLLYALNPFRPNQSCRRELVYWFVLGGVVSPGAFLFTFLFLPKSGFAATIPSWLEIVGDDTALLESPSSRVVTLFFDGPFMLACCCVRCIGRWSGCRKAKSLVRR